MRLETMQRLAGRIVGRLEDVCERVVVAGSVRRLKADCHDIEIVALPKMVRDVGTVTLFDMGGEVPATDARIEALVREGFWKYDPELRRAGPRYKRMVLLPEGVAVDLFFATAENWGYILALRTGPAAFNKMLVQRRMFGGMLPPEIALDGGRVWQYGRPVAVPSEREFFELIEVPYCDPWDRAALVAALAI